jgi:type I restriction enzyme S subunit
VIAVWSTNQLGELAENVSRPFDFKGKDKVIFVNTSDVLEGKFLHAEYTSVKGLPGQAKKAIKKGDILYSEIRPGNKRYAFVDFDAEDYVVSTKFMVIRPKCEISAEYLYVILTSQLCEQEFKIIAESRSGTFPQITFDSVSYFPVNYPDKINQNIIYRILYSFNQKIQLNSEINQNLESIAQAIFKSWFIDFDPVRAKIAAKQEGKDSELAAMCAISGKSQEELKQMSKDDFAELQASAALFPDELVETELGEVPKGWEYKKLKDLCRVINGRAYKNTEFKEEGIPIVRIQNLTGGGKTVFSDLDLPQDKLIEKEDFIYAWSATFGPYIWRGPKSIYHYHIWKMDVDETIISRYFLYLTMFRKTESMKSSGTGSIFTHLTKAIMESQDVLIADNAINMLFKDRIDRIFKLISLKSDEINNLENIRDTLLPKLLSGEIDVSDLGSETEYEYSTK